MLLLYNITISILVFNKIKYLNGYYNLVYLKKSFSSKLKRATDDTIFKENLCKTFKLSGMEVELSLWLRGLNISSNEKLFLSWDTVAPAFVCSGKVFPHSRKTFCMPSMNCSMNRELEFVLNNMKYVCRVFNSYMCNIYNKYY